jgi:hypothetical protein
MVTLCFLFGHFDFARPEGCAGEKAHDQVTLTGSFAYL